jgi:hypothetical protein
VLIYNRFLDERHVPGSVVPEERSSSEQYLDVSSKDAHVLPDLPVPNCDCGRPAWVCQSKHPNTAARCFYLCGSFNVSSL